MVNRIDDARLSLKRQVELTTVAGKLRVSIDGEPQDEGIIALVRPVIERELRARMKSLEVDLVALGVKVS